MIVYLTRNRATGKAYVWKTKRPLVQRWLKLSPQHCKNISCGQIGKPKPFVSKYSMGEGNPLYGRHHSGEARQKIVAATSIRKRKAVARCDVRGTVLVVYPSNNEAASAIGGQFSKISDVLNKRRITHKGYYWQYVKTGQIPGEGN